MYLNLTRWMSGLLGGFLCSLVLAQDQLKIEGGYIPAMPPTMKNTAAYFTLVNQGPEPVVLTGAYTEIAEQVTLHETLSNQGQMYMRKRDSVEIAAGDILVLENGSMHLMITGLKSVPAPGDEVSLILEFEGELELPLTLPVQSLLPDEADDMNHQH